MKPGDVVVLKSDGYTRMTVEKVDGEKVFCIWLNKAKKQERECSSSPPCDCGARTTSTSRWGRRVTAALARVYETLRASVR